MIMQQQCTKHKNTYKFTKKQASYDSFVGQLE